MNPTLASLIYAGGIAGLFYLNRDRSLRTSKALWLPVMWIWLAGSRGVSEWFGISTQGDVQLQGSPIDAAIFGILAAAAIGVLIRRSSRTRSLLAANLPILIFFLFCLISVAWSYHPDVAFKRWIKAIGDLAMVLVVATEPHLRDALSRLFSRVGFVLFPASLLLIKYYGDFGRGYTPDGEIMNTGVTTNKNSLGVMLLVISLGTLWQLITLLRARGKVNRGRHLFAQGVLLAFGLLLLRMASSATSIACFLLGSGLIFATSLRAFRNRPARVHALCLAIVLGGGFALLSGGEGNVAHVMGRQSNLSGRTEIWAALIPTVPNSIVGAGFESYWISPSTAEFQRTLLGLGWWHPEGLNEAHDGYLEVYLNLGWVGVGLIAMILITAYWRASAALRVNPSIGGLMLAYIVASAVYSITEAGFRMLNPRWIFLLLAMVGATAVVTRLVRDEERNIPASRIGATRKMRIGAKLVQWGETV